MSLGKPSNMDFLADFVPQRNWGVPPSPLTEKFAKYYLTASLMFSKISSTAKENRRNDKFVNSNECE